LKAAESSFVRLPLKSGKTIGATFTENGTFSTSKRERLRRCQEGAVGGNKSEQRLFGSDSRTSNKKAEKGKTVCAGSAGALKGKGASPNFDLGATIRKPDSRKGVPQGIAGTDPGPGESSSLSKEAILNEVRKPSLKTGVGELGTLKKIYL